MLSELQTTVPPERAEVRSDERAGRPVRGWTRRARRLPADDHGCGWIETLPDPPPPRHLRADEAVDCAIVGAGFTGLAVARRLAECRPGWKVALFDAQRVGFGASGRCSGFLVDVVDFTSKMTPENRDGYVRTARWGIERLRQLKDEHGFDPEWDDTGWVRGAVGEEGMRFLEAWPRLLDEAGIEYHWLDRAGMTGVTGSELYQAGIRLPGYPLIHGGKLVRGLWQSLPAEVEVFEESPVLSVQRVPRGGFKLEVGVRNGGDAGRFFTVAADKLFLTTNGYLPSQRFLANRVFPCFTFGSMTRVLSESEQRALGGEREWGLLAMDPMGTTVRRTRGQRLLLRNTAHATSKLGLPDSLRAKMRQHHRRALAARFPALADIELEYTWGGLMGTSHNSQPYFGQLEPDLYSTAAFNAAGIAMGTAAGEVLADWALGNETEHVRALRALPAPTWMPPEPFRGLGGRAIVARKNAQAASYI